MNSLGRRTVRTVILQEILDSQTLTLSWRQVFKLFILLIFLFDACQSWRRLHPAFHSKIRRHHERSRIHSINFGLPRH